MVAHARARTDVNVARACMPIAVQSCASNACHGSSGGRHGNDGSSHGSSGSSYGIVLAAGVKMCIDGITTSTACCV